MEIMINKKRKKHLDIGLLNTISHNLRTPLTCLIGFSRLLEATKLTKKQKEYLGNLQLSTCQLKINIEDLLMLLSKQKSYGMQKYEQKI